MERDRLLAQLGGVGQATAFGRGKTELDASARRAAAEALADFDDASVVRALCESLAEVDSSVCLSVVGALTRLRDPESIPFLADVASSSIDGEPGGVRAAALEALLCFRSPEACRSLAASLVEHPSAAPVGWARHALRAALAADATATGARLAAELLIERLGDGSPAAARAAELLPCVAEEAEEPLIELLRDGPSPLAQRAARALGTLRGGPPFDALVCALRTGTVEVRAEAARALGAQRDPGAVPVLIEALGDAEEAVRSEAATGLDALGVGAATTLAISLAAGGTGFPEQPSLAPPADRGSEGSP